jgi:hypothetical protein
MGLYVYDPELVEPPSQSRSTVALDDWGRALNSKMLLRQTSRAVSHPGLNLHAGIHECLHICMHKCPVPATQWAPHGHQKHAIQ